MDNKSSPVTVRELDGRAEALHAVVLKTPIPLSFLALQEFDGAQHWACHVTKSRTDVVIGKFVSIPSIPKLTGFVVMQVDMLKEVNQPMLVCIRQDEILAIHSASGPPIQMTLAPSQEDDPVECEAPTEGSTLTASCVRDA